MVDKKICFNCGEKGGEYLCGYYVCKGCKSKIGLLSDETIKKHISIYKNKTLYEKEIDRRLEFIEVDYIKKKIKLMHVKDRLGMIK